MWPIFTTSKWGGPILAGIVYLMVSGVVANAYGLVRLGCRNISIFRKGEIK